MLKIDANGTVHEFDDQDPLVIVETIIEITEEHFGEQPNTVATALEIACELLLRGVYVWEDTDKTLKITIVER